MATSSDRDPVEMLAEEFIERHRQGERPPLSEYTAKCPERADEIRALFPALIEMEQLASIEGPHTGPLTSAAAVRDLRLRQLGDYRIVREIGYGGMGVVYEAVQESLGRHVALKVLPWHGLLNPAVLERFRREARAAARLHHTNIVPVFGVGEDDGVHYYAMQCIQGQGLNLVLEEVRRLRGHPAAPEAADRGAGDSVSACVARGLISGPPGAAAPAPIESLGDLSFTSVTESQYFRSVARAGLQVAEGLAYAHSQGVLHRDIKPSNLLLDTHGTVWIADFGLAKTDDSDDLTNTGDLVGTLRFMAPERFDGKCDVRSEVYSVGVTLYEMATLRPAFAEADKMALLEKLRFSEPPRPSRCDPRIPRDLETIILKAMARHPAERYPTAKALAEDLQRFLADRPIRARRSSTAERLWRWCRRNRAVASLMALALLLLVTVAIVSTVAAVWLKGERDHVTQTERERRLQLVEALQDRAHAGRMSRRLGQRFASLDALHQAAQLARELDLPPDRLAQLRNEAIACLALPDVSLARKWDLWPAGTVSASFDDAYQQYARIDRQGQISVRRVADDVELDCLSAFGPGDSLWAGWSRDGRYLAAADGNRRQLKVWRFAGPKMIAALPPLSDAIGYDFSPDSQQLAVTTQDGKLTIYDLNSGREVKRPTLGGDGQSVTFHPREQWLAAAMGNKVRIYDLQTDEKLGEDLAHPAPVGSVAWHPDGRTLAAACDDLKIYVWDLATRRQTAVLEGCRNKAIAIRFNHAGDLLVSWGWEGMLRFWHPRTGKQVFSTPGGMLATSFSPDDRQIAARLAGPSGQLEAGLWNVAAFREYRTLVHDPVPDLKPAYYGGSLHPNGRWLALGMGDGARIWDLPSGRQLAWLPMKPVGGVWFEPLGALLTNGDSGWWRWPVSVERAPEAPLRIGPPERLPIPGLFMTISGSRDGRVLAQPFYNGAYVLHADQPYQPVRLSPHDTVNGVSVSPNGRWVATGSHHGTGVKVWEAATGKLVKDLLGDYTCCAPNFSPDGRWLATSALEHGCWLWAVEAWEPGIHIPNGWGMMFTADGRVMATSVALGVLALIDPATGQEYARMEDPNQDNFDWFTFSTNGAQLITSSDHGQAIHVWDLHLIRRQLAELGLDWDGPPYWPPGETPDNHQIPTPPAKLEVRGLDLVTTKEKWRQYQHARDGLALAVNPFDAEAHFRLGEDLLGGGKAAAAYSHFTFALTFRSGFGAAHASRAQAAFRLGRWAEAVADADAVLRDQPYDGEMLFLRGLAYQRLGRHAEAEGDFNAALARDPGYSRLIKLRGASPGRGSPNVPGP